MSVHDLGRRFTRKVPASAPLALVIVTYNSAEVLRGLLDSLPGGLEGVGDCRIIVVDNDSRDASPEIATFHPTRPEVLRTGRNAGYAGGINAAARMVSPDADLLILNPDIRLERGAAKRMQDRLVDPRIGVVVPQLRHMDGTIAHSLRREPTILTAWAEALLGGRIACRFGASEIVGNGRLYARGGEVDWASGAALMIAAHARQRAGEWDESFFLYSEEVDYMRRVRTCGLAIEYLAQARATHIGGDYESSPFLSALMTTNRVRDYGRRHGPVKTALFRSGLALGAALRAPAGASHRASLRAALAAPSR